MFKKVTGNKVRNKNKSFKRKTRFWIISATTAGIVFAFTVGNSRAMNIGFERAENKPVIERFYAGDEKNNLTRFNIAPGLLSEVVAAFEKASGWRVQLSDDVKDIQSSGVTGDYTEEQALKMILQNTGVTYAIISPQNVTLRLQGPAETVEVVGENSTLQSPKYTQPIKDIPQTITVINKKAIEEQGATTLRDVLQNVPGLTITAGEGGAPAGDNLTLRGFSARNDIFVDGVRDLSPQSRDPFNLEQVEVTKGPTSAISGRGSTGGTINLISKTPAFSPFYNFDVVFGTDKTKRVTGDVSVPLDKLGLGERTSFRLNAMYHDSNFAGRDEIENNRWGVAPTLSFGIAKNTFLTLGYFRLQQDNISDYGIPWVPIGNNVLIPFRDRPAPVPRDTFYGFLNRDKEKLRSDLATIQLTHTFSDALSLRNQFRYGNSIRDSIATPPRFAGNNSTLINRELRSWITEDDVYDNQTDFTARFNTDSVRHALVTGAMFTREENIRQLRTASNSTTTLLNPNPNDTFPFVISTSPFLGDITADSQAFYIFDTASFGEKFDLTGGIRWDRFDASGLSLPVSITDPRQIPFARIDKFLSYRFGAVYRPLPFGSVYGSVASSFNPSLEGLSIGASTALNTLEPEKTYNYELGTKWDLLSNRILLTAAIFRVDKTNARTPDVDNVALTVLEGRQRVDGIELGATGIITRGWNVLAAYTLLDSKILESNANLSGGQSLEIGKRLINTPRNSFSLWSTYQTPWRLTVGGGARYVGKRFGNTINTRFVESHYLFDAMASYRINKYINLHANAYNLTNEYYFDRIGGGHLVPGAGRYALFGFGLNF